MKKTKRYKINAMQVRALYTTTGVKNAAMANLLNVCSRDTLKRQVDDADMRIDIFVSVVNHFRLDWTKYIIEEGDEEKIEPAVVNLEEWESVDYHSELIGNEFTTIPSTIKLGKLLKSIPSRGLTPHDLLTGGRIVKAVDASCEQCDVKVEGSSMPFVYNSSLFSSLPVLLNENRNNIGIASGHSTNLYGYAEQTKNITVRALVDVCNTYRIDVMHFFVREDMQAIPSSLVTGIDEWSPIEFHVERFCQVAGESMGIATIQSILGWSKQRWMRTVSENSPIRADELCRICNRFGVSPSFFFDSNELHVDNMANYTMQRRVDSLIEEVRKLRAENNRLTAELRHTKSLLDMANSTNRMLEE